MRLECRIDRLLNTYLLRRKIMKINEKGRSMIEMLGVLAIIGVLSVGGIAGYSKAMAKFRANKTIDQVSHIVANVRILFGSQKNYADLAKDSSVTNVPSLMYKAHVFPDEMLGGTAGDSMAWTDWNNAYGGSVELYSASRFAIENGSGQNDATKKHKAFMIVFGGIPKEACVDLASQNWDASSGSGLIAFAINDTETLKSQVYDGCTSTGSAGKALSCFSAMPMPVAWAANACTEATTNELAWKYY